MGAPSPDEGRSRIAVWDAPVRIVHWAIVVGFAALWWTGTSGQLGWHKIVGLALLALVVFRLIWGVAGSSTARFAGFVRGPASVARYAAGLLRREAKAAPIGHNPVGGWSVVALLALTAADIGCGLFAEDADGLESGPLASRVNFEFGRAAAHWHGVLFNALLALVALHLAAIVFYALVRRENLVGPMLSGSRRAAEGVQGMRPGRPVALVLAAVAALAAALWVSRGFAPL